MLDNQGTLRIRAGARRWEMLVYLVLDGNAAAWSFRSALGHGWSPYLFLLIIAVPASVLGLGMVTSMLLVGRAPRMTMNSEGISVDSDGRHWHCTWSDVVWIGVVGNLAQFRRQPVMVAQLGPEAPPVGRSLTSPPARLPDSDLVVMINLKTIIENRQAAIASARRIAGPKWRA